MIDKIFLAKLFLAGCYVASVANVAGANNMITSVRGVTSLGSRNKPMKKNTRTFPKQRFRRETYAKSAGLSSEEATVLLRKHNEFRAMQNASNMLIMEWNTDLQKLAQDLADRCNFQHSPKSYRSNVGGFKSIGENLFYANYKFPVTLPVQNWYDEIVDYQYDTARCYPRKVCGHYTQVVWHHSYALGCGVKHCENLQNAGEINTGYLVVCHYGPTGNYRDVKPFSKGQACSECDKNDLPYCVRGMCSKRPQVGSASKRLTSLSKMIVLTLLLILKTIDLDSHL